MNSRFRVFVWATCAAALGITLVILAARFASDRKEDLWFEIGNAGIQLTVLTIIGGLVATGLRHLDSIREEQRRLNDYRLAILRQVITSYNQIKAARRTMRAFGFRSPTTGTLREYQVEEFVAQMKSLNTAQLALEGVFRDMEVCRETFLRYPDVLKAVRHVADYINGIIKDWERNATAVTVGTDATVVNAMMAFQAFLDKSALSFKKGAAEPIERLEERIRAEVLPRSVLIPRLPR